MSFLIDPPILVSRLCTEEHGSDMLNKKQKEADHHHTIIDAVGKNGGAWKWSIRKRIWDLLERENIASFPRPVHHRIPNFVGAAMAASQVIQFILRSNYALPNFLNFQILCIHIHVRMGTGMLMCTHTYHTHICV